MKRFFVVAAMAVMFAASAASAAYEVCTGAYAGSCRWNGTGCDVISISPGESWSKATCKEAYENCEAYGELFSDDACTNKIGGAETCGGYCQWSTGCWEIKTDPKGSTPITSCTDAIANCDKNGVRYDASTASGEGTTCDGTVVGGTKPCGQYCQWATGCYEIKPDPSGSPATTTCEEAIANCERDGQLFSSSSSTGDGTTCNGTQIGGDEPCGSYCKWTQADGTTECVENKTDKNGTYHDGTPVTSCTEVVDNCKAYGEMYSDKNCTVALGVRLVANKAATPGLKVSYAKGRVSVNWTPTAKIAKGTVQLINAKGVALSTAFIKDNSSKVSVKLGTVGVPAGMYFVHINAVGQNGQKIVSQSAISIVK